MYQRLIAVLFAAAVAGQTVRAADSVATATNKPPENTFEIVARVNGKQIMRRELDLAVKGLKAQLQGAGRPVPTEQTAKLENDVLEEMISRELVLQEGSTHPPTNIDAQVNQQLDAVKKRLGGDDGFKKALDESGVAIGEYTRRLRDNVVVQDTVKQVMESEVKLTPEEVKSYYDTHSQEFVRPEMARASHILVRVRADASEVDKNAAKAKIDAARSLVKNGEKFADVAKKVSEDPGSAQNGGDLGLFGRGQMVPEFDAAAFSLPTNQVSDVITTQFGYHVLIVTERQPSRKMAFDEVHKDLENFMRMRKGPEIVRAHVKALREKGDVQVYLKGAAAKPAPAASAAEPAKKTPDAEKPNFR